MTQHTPELAAIIGMALAEWDGYDEDSVHQLLWVNNGDPMPEPLGTAWECEYYPKGEMAVKLFEQRTELLREEAEKYHSELLTVKANYDSMKQQRDELLHNLKKHGKHLDGCDSFPRHEYDQRYLSEMLCDCGLDTAIAKAQEVQL